MLVCCAGALETFHLLVKAPRQALYLQMNSACLGLMSIEPAMDLHPVVIPAELCLQTPPTMHQPEPVS